jgi:hypothetical protein
LSPAWKTRRHGHSGTVSYVHWSYAKASLRVLLGLDPDELSS